jgi:5-hydroxyisourate hydrolase
MSGLTTHVLDTAHGCPAAGMVVTLSRREGDAFVVLRTVTLNDDGRAGGPLIDGPSLTRGCYRLEFAVADYFRGRGLTLADPPFIDRVPLDFGIADVTSHYHVPLLVSPFSYATYRGS